MFFLNQLYIVEILTRQMTTSQLKKHEPLRYLLIRLNKLELTQGHTIRADQFIYYSFSLAEHMYFSSVMDTNVTTLNDDIIIPFESSQIPDFIQLQRWQSHMIMFVHEVDLGDLKTRTSAKKTLETRSGQVLSFMITVLTDEEIKFGNKLIRSISQHYLIIQSFVLKNYSPSSQQGESGPSYFIMRTSQTDYVMPIIDGEICIKLPETVEFQHIRNGVLVGKSEKLKTDQFRESDVSVRIEGRNGNSSADLSLQLRWGINLFQAKAENTLLLEAHEILIYNIEIKFESVVDNNIKVKFIYGNKSFDVGAEFSSSKPVKTKKIIYFMIKSEDEQIYIVVEKNMKIIAQSRFYTDQIVSHTVNNPKRKFIDNNGKNIGYVKFKCEKGKSLSTPNNNKFWKECHKKKTVNTMILSVEQISVNYVHEEPVSVVIKTESEERVLENVPNFEYFSKTAEVSCIPNVFTSKMDQNIYLMVKHASQKPKNDENNVDPVETDFIGIAILNFSTLRLGMNSVLIPFFKSQTKTVEVNCLINKVPSYPFIKSSFQSEILLPASNKTLSLSVAMKKVTFSPYFFTFRYDNKNQVYCIVEVNRIKKVLIMESTEDNQLVFTSTSSSDALNFVIEDTEFLKIKILFLVSDIGHEEQIYGTVLIKLKTQQLLAAAGEGVPYDKIAIKNDFGTVVGAISSVVYKGNMARSLSNSKQKLQRSYQEPAEIEAEKYYFQGQPPHTTQLSVLRQEEQEYAQDQTKNKLKTGPFKSDLRRIQKDLTKVNNNMEVVERSLDKKSAPTSHRSVNPIRNHIRKAGPQYKKQQIYYDNKKQYGRNRNHSLHPSNQDNGSLVLPSIKNGSKSSADSKNNLKQLIQMMKIRKKTNKGGYEQSPTAYVKGAPLSDRYQKKSVKNKQKMATDQNQSVTYISKQKIERENPNMQKNMDILFPKKSLKGSKVSKAQKNQEQPDEKLKGMKSVYNEISQDIKQIQPSLKHDERQEMNGPQWEDNEFAVQS